MLDRHLIRSASLVLVVAALAACGQEDLTVAVAENASGASMGVEPAVKETPISPEAPAAARAEAAAQAAAQAVALPASADEPRIPEAAADAVAVAGPPAGAPASALEAAAAAAEARAAVAASETDADASDASDETPESFVDQPIGDLSDASDQPALPPVDEPMAPPTRTTGATGAAGDSGGDGAASADDELEEDVLPEEGEWTPPPIEDPRLVDGVWRVSFDYLGSFDTGKLALPEDSPMAIEARREQRMLEEKPDATPTGLPPESDDLPIAPATEIGIPEAVRKMDGQIVRIEGYMIPLKFEDGKVKSFFLSRYMMGCCFGVLPKANEIIEVEMAEGKGAFYDAYMPFIVKGKFVIVEDGTDAEYMQSVFRMTAESCDYSEDW